MGLESYFIDLLPGGARPTKEYQDGVWLWEHEGHSKVDANAICERLLASFQAKEETLPDWWHARKFIVEDGIEVWIYEEDGFFQVAVLVGGFAWYGPGLRLMYRVARIIKEHVDVQVVFYERYAPLTTRVAFIEHVQGMYASKHREFVRIFGDREERLLPNTSFYRYDRRSKHFL